MTILSEETINKLVEMSRRYPKRFRGLPERIPPNDRRLHEVRHQDTVVEMPTIGRWMSGGPVRIGSDATCW